MKNVRKNGFCVRRSLRTEILLGLLAWPVAGISGDYFDPALLTFGESSLPQDVDLARFETPGYESPGDYTVDIYVNGHFYRSQKLSFISVPEKGLQPELTRGDLESMGVNTTGLPLAPVPADQYVGAIEQLIPSASARLDFQAMRLNISVPQVSMRTTISGAVDPALWDQGILAALFSYNLNGNTSRQKGNEGGSSDNDSLFASLGAGVNAGPWRLRSNATWSHSRQQNDRYDTQDMAMRRMTSTQNQFKVQETYLQRDIQSLKGELTLGDASTGDVASQVFDGFTYRGGSLASNTSMIPSVIRDFAPVIAGVANSNARVTVRQNGSIIYQTNVAPGPFRITDLSGGSTAGDLLVTITEADGTIRSFRQAYSALPVLQRPGQLKYEMVVGRYRPGGGYQEGNAEPGFALGALIYGLPYGVTLFGGGLVSQDYQSAGIGSGLSLGLAGALSAGVTASRTKLPEATSFVSGESYSVRYSKSLRDTGTLIDLAAYRYSTARFYSFQNANTQGYRWQNADLPWMNERLRSSHEIRVSQSLPGNMSAYLSGGQDSYWGSSRTNTRLFSGLSGSWRQIGWTLSYNISRIRGDGSWPENRQVGMNLSLPLSLPGSSMLPRQMYSSYSMTHDSQGRTSNMLGISSSALDDQRLSWNLSQSQVNQGGTNTSSAGINYAGSSARISGGYTRGGNSSSVYYGLSGGVVAHPWGITLSSQPLYSSAVLIRAPGADDVRVMSGAGIRTNHQGYAVVPYASDYSRNSISLDPTTLPPGADLNETSKNVYPTQGAVVVADYNVRMGQQVLMTLNRGDGVVPFGAIVSLQGDDRKDSAAIVGEQGLVYLSGLPQQGRLLVTWGSRTGSQCRVDYRLQAPKKPAKRGHWSPVREIQETCK